MTGFPTKSSKTFSPRCPKYNEMKKDIRVGFKNKVKKTAEGLDAVEFSARSSGEVSQLRREIHAEIIKKLALEEDRRK